MYILVRVRWSRLYNCKILPRYCDELPSLDQPIARRRGAPSRPASKPASKRSARRTFDMATGASMFFCAASLIRSLKTGPFRVRVFRGIFPWLGGAETVKASQFSDAQKAFILRQGADGVPVADVCRKAGIRQATYFNWKKKYEGLQPPEDAPAEAARGREREAEEDRGGPVTGSRDASGRHPPKTVRPARKRELATTVCDDWGVSIRRACRRFSPESPTA